MQSGTDPCFYRLICDGHSSFLAIYVDDILLMSISDMIRENILQALKERFSIKIMGPAAWILSLHINQMPSSITFDQMMYITELLRRYGMQKCDTCMVIHPCR